MRTAPRTTFPQLYRDEAVAMRCADSCTVCNAEIKRPAAVWSVGECARHGVAAMCGCCAEGLKDPRRSAWFTGALKRRLSLLGVRDL